MRKKFLHNLIITAALLAPTMAHADNFWTRFPGSQAPTALERQVNPYKYQIFNLNDDAFNAYTANLSDKIENGILLDIPTPDGKTRTFKIWSTPFITKAMMEKYPEIKMITGVDINDPSSTVKLVYTTYGLSGQIFTGKGESIIIQPYANENTGYYLSYYSKDEPQEPVNCGVAADESYDVLTPTNRNFETEYTHGAVQRKFRLSMSSTTQWSRMMTGAQNPTLGQVYAKVLEVVNRMIGFHEREIAVTYELISDEVMLFANTALDPFTCNANMSCLLDENQTHTDLRIGRTNYDIGHILCTAGGGLAQLYATCTNNGKARGASTISSTTYIKTLLHEVGHQFGASHTFSANVQGCNGNGMPEGAYEPGSGSTIMSYSGSCSPSNIFTEPNTEDYYHVFSLLQMSEFIGTLRCGTSSTNIPVLNIPKNTSVYNIPRNTPFELEGSTATVNGSQVPQVFTYNWEQFDNKFDLVEANGGTEVTGPTLRSHHPKASTVQSYPVADSILANKYSSVGYRLPTNARDLHFKFTARGVLNGRGAFNTIDSVVTVKAAGSSSNFRVTSYNNMGSTVTFNPGDQVTFTWDVGNSNQAPVNCGGVSIYLYAPNDPRGEYQLVSYAPNTGSFSYTIPDMFVQDAYLKIKGAGNIFYDLGKTKININGSNTSVNDINIANAFNIYPNPTKDVLTVSNTNSNELFRVTIYNSVGQEIYNTEMQSQTTINTSHYSAGNYFIKLQHISSGKTGTKQFVVAK